MTNRHPSAIDERTYQRRRLGVLSGLLALVLAVGATVGAGGGDPDGDVQVAAGGQQVRIASVGSPSAVRELLSDTTTTLVEATGSSTTTTAPPTTTTTVAPTATTEADPVEVDEPEVEATTTTEAPAPATTSTTTSQRAHTHAAPATTAAPTTTAAPPTTTTTAPPPPTTEASSGGGYAYDDPRSTQVWYDLAQCESGGNWSIDTGNGYYGGLQFSLGTWESVGGTGYPHEHPAGTQIEMGRRLQARQGWGAWPHCSEELGLT